MFLIFFPFIFWSVVIEDYCFLPKYLKDEGSDIGHAKAVGNIDTSYYFD